MAKINRILINEIWSQDDQEGLEEAISESRNVSDAIKKKSVELKANKTFQLRAKQPLTNNNFGN